MNLAGRFSLLPKINWTLEGYKIQDIECTLQKLFQIMYISVNSTFINTLINNSVFHSKGT